LLKSHHGDLYERSAFFVYEGNSGD
jgi:hypothetical protein